MPRLVIALLGVVMMFSACASGPRIDTGPGGLPPAIWGWNIGAADLLDPATAPCRLGVYLDELATQGYAKQIRIIYTPVWGPFILEHWVPVIRAKGFRVLVILSQDGRGGTYGDDSGLTAQEAWMAHGLPAIADVLDAVQLANEPDGFSGKTPGEYAQWHRGMAAAVRAVMPGVTIVGPDLRGVGTWNQWVLKTGLRYGIDYDILSLHVTHQDRLNELRRFVRDARAFTGTWDPVTWITEGDWGQVRAFSRIGLLPERTYIYVWNCNPTGKGAACERETRRPGGDVVSCEK